MQQALFAALEAVNMRRILTIVGMLLALSTQVLAANSTVTAMTAASALGGTELLYVVQGAADRKGTPAQIATYVYGLASGDCTISGVGAIVCTKTNSVAFGTAATAATGTSGHTLPFLDGTNTFSGTQTFGTVVGSVNAQAGTTYTLAATDCGKTVIITNGSAITLTTLNSLPIGCSIAVEQGGAGQITVANGAGATLTSAHSFTKTFAAAGAIIGLFVDTNAGGTAAHFVLTGDGA